MGPPGDHLEVWQRLGDGAAAGGRHLLEEEDVEAAVRLPEDLGAQGDLVDGKELALDVHPAGLDVVEDLHQSAVEQREVKKLQRHRQLDLHLREGRVVLLRVRHDLAERVPLEDEAGPGGPPLLHGPDAAGESRRGPGPSAPQARGGPVGQGHEPLLADALVAQERHYAPRAQGPQQPLRQRGQPGAREQPLQLRRPIHRQHVPQAPPAAAGPHRALHGLGDPVRREAPELEDVAAHASHVPLHRAHDLLRLLLRFRRCHKRIVFVALRAAPLLHPLLLHAAHVLLVALGQHEVPLLADDNCAVAHRSEEQAQHDEGVGL
mmetsp:Transcript_110242/g.295867  ORF Transcript_110242/g.295867 Transcript_110242/m.295867 type:complete len:320 (+) Transcript_110242:667-1626(+)